MQAHTEITTADCLSQALAKSWRKPLRAPQFFTNALLESWPAAPDESADSLRPHLIRKLYNRHGRLPQLTQSIRELTQAYSRNAGTPVAAPGSRGRALVLLLRAFGYPHALHNYLVAHALRDLGFQVQLVLCDGVLESCGSGSSQLPLTSPPFLCRECRSVAAAFDTRGFDTVRLDAFADKTELAWLEQIKSDPAQDFSTLTLDGLAIGRWMQPYLMRYTRGHRGRISLRDPEVRQHTLGMARLASRYRQLLDREKPKVVVLFNGLFAPEAIFHHLTRARAIATVCTERGPRKNTLFLSSDAACHYRSPQLWGKLRGTLTQREIDESRASMESRRKVNLDPSGRPRPIEVTDTQKYDELSREPYVVFFPPIFHDTASMEKPSPFSDIFAAIDALCEEAIGRNTRLVIRAHPDEAAAEAAGAFRVGDYLAERGYLANPCIRLLPPQEKWNAYLLAANAKSAVVYNGTLGMELPALGQRVYNIAQSHYAGKGFTEDFQSPQDVARVFDSTASKEIAPAAHEEALRYWHYYYNLASLPIGALMDEVEPSQFELNTAAPDAEHRAVRTELVWRVALLVK